MPLGFTWGTTTMDLDLPRHSTKRAVWRMRKTMSGFVWDTVVLEGNPDRVMS
jgi:hypothetical protein